jgi:hypothetical protein
MIKSSVKMSSNENRMVPNNQIRVHLWSLSLVLLHFITIISTQGLSQHFEKPPDGEYFRLKDQRLEIPCIVRNRQGECQWLHNGKVIGNIPRKYKFERTPNDGDCSITINDLDLKNDDGQWQCQVTAASIGQETLSSQFAQVVVLVAPTKPVIKQVKDNKLRLPADRSNEIECQSDYGNPLPRIEWFIDGENVTQNSRSSVVETTSDTKSVVSYLNHTFKRSHRNSTITCQALHPTVDQNTSAIIDVLYAPQVSVPQKIYTVNEDSDLRIECQVDANPPTKAIWKPLNSQLPNVGYESNYLIIHRISKDMNNAEFECTAQNEFGFSQTVSIKLDVLYQPRLSKASDPQQTVEIGQPFSLECNYDGNPVPKITWYHINPISDEVRERLNSVEDPRVLWIKNATYHDEGHYYCEGLNHNVLIDKDFVVRSAKFTVDIIGKPAVIQNPGAIQGYRSAITDVEQLFCSDPLPTSVYWRFGSMRIDVRSTTPPNPLWQENNTSQIFTRHKARSLVPLDKTGTSSSSPTCFRAILSIYNTDISDQRDYELIVENSRGIMESVVKLKVSSPISAAIMITIGLIILIMLFAFTLVTMLIIKRRKQGKQKSDDESKAEARGIEQELKV